MSSIIKALNYNLNIIVFVTVITGSVVFMAGLLTGIYPRKGRYLYLKEDMNLETLANLKYIRPIIRLFIRNEKGSLYKFGAWIIRNSEAGMSVQGLYVLKISAIMLTAFLAIMVRQTNIDVDRLAIINKSSETMDFFSSNRESNNTYNATFYKAILRKAGDEALKKASKARRYEIVKKIIPETIKSNNPEIVNERTNSFIKTYNAVQQVNLFNWWIILAIAASFWLPEAILLLKRVLKNSRYKKEVIKLENIFELLGSIKGFKTLDIIEEMEKSSKPYSKHLNSCRELFKTEKELALETLRHSVKNKRLSKLVDVIRVYALTDKALALQILERNKLEKDEEIFLTAEEDVDMADLIAFISIVPILFELANLMMKPMLDMIYDAFKFV